MHKKRKIILISFLIPLALVFISNCRDRQKDNSIKSALETKKDFSVDTTIKGYDIYLKMSKELLEKEDTNNIYLEIDDFDTKNIIIYTSASEAVVNRGKSSGYFKIIPNPQTDEVTINLNLMEKTSMKSIGQITLKAK